MLCMQLIKGQHMVVKVQKVTSTSQVPHPATCLCTRITLQQCLHDDVTHLHCLTCIVHGWDDMQHPSMTYSDVQCMHA